MKIYIASRVRHQAKWVALRARGVPLSCHWIDASSSDADDPSFWTRVVKDVGEADVLALYVEPDDLPFRGALIECGAALALGAPIVVISDNIDLSALGRWTNHPLVRHVKTFDAFIELNKEQP